MDDISRDKSLDTTSGAAGKNRNAPTPGTDDLRDDRRADLRDFERMRLSEEPADAADEVRSRLELAASVPEVPDRLEAAPVSERADEPADEPPPVNAGLPEPADEPGIEPGDEADLPALDDGLPDAPELTDPATVGRLSFVLLLSQRDGLSLLRLAQTLNTTQKLVEEGLQHLQAMLVQIGVPAEVVRTEGSVRLLSTPDAHLYLTRLRGVKKQEKLSQAALETLAVIAYRQPVMRSEIEAIRGVKAGPMLRTLLQHKLVKVTGRADVPGRPLQYGTTPHFLERFGLQSLKDLPSIKEFKQLG